MLTRHVHARHLLPTLTREAVAFNCAKDFNVIGAAADVSLLVSIVGQGEARPESGHRCEIKGAKLALYLPALLQDASALGMRLVSDLKKLLADLNRLPERVAENLLIVCDPQWLSLNLDDLPIECRAITDEWPDHVEGFWHGHAGLYPTHSNLMIKLAQHL